MSLAARLCSLWEGLQVECKQDSAQRKSSSSPLSLTLWEMWALLLAGWGQDGVVSKGQTWLAVLSLSTRTPYFSFISQNLAVSSWSKGICSYLKMSYIVLDSAFKQKEGRKNLHWGKGLCLIRSSLCHRLKNARKFQAKGRYFIYNSFHQAYFLLSSVCKQWINTRKTRIFFFFFGHVNSCHNLGIAFSFNLIRI